eukprot:scaffold4239_cov80-Cylindrotheca_fusiformis.AAC.9
MKRSSRNPYGPLCLYMMIISVVLVCSTASPTVRYLHGRLQVDDSSVMTTTTDGTDSRAATAVLLEYHTNTTVAKAWRHCQTNLLDCVSFGYQATARFPGETVAVSFYSVADWHVNVNDNGNDLSHQPAFIEEESWHLYVNTTREQRILKDEVNGVLRRLRAAATTTTATGEINNNNNSGGDGRASSSSSLRNGLRRARVAENDNHHVVAGPPPPSFRAEQERMASLMSLFYMVQYKDLRVPCSKLITRPVLNIAMDETEMEEIRGVALQVLLVLTDSYETPRLLNEYGDLLTNMESIIISQQQGRQQQTDNDDDDKGTWGMVAKVALDIVSSMALHHTVEYPFVPSPKLLNALHQIVMSDESGPIGVQATLALIHASTTTTTTTTTSTISKTITTQQQQLPEDKLVALVDLLEATIDGDPAFGYDWELIPGPLSAIQTLIVESKKTVEHGEDGSAATIVDKLFEAGLMEQLIRILEEETSSHMDAHTTLAALQIMDNVRTISPMAYEMVAMAASTLHHVQDRLQLYEAPLALARTLTTTVGNHKLHQGSVLEDQEL